METPDILNSKSLKGFIKGSLVLVGLFAVLYCGIFALLLRSDKIIDIGKNIENYVIVLIFFLVCLPILVFIAVFLRFSCLAKCYYDKIYVSSCNKHEYIICKIREEIICQMNKEKENILETQKNEETLLNKRKIEVMGDVCLAVAKAIKPDYEKNDVALDKIKDMLGMLSKIGSGEDEPK